MKKIFPLLFVLTIFTIKAQSNCDDANSYIVNAYSHVKDAYEANNMSHLKYYANRSLESFKLSKKSLENCGCQTALALANKSLDLLAKVDDVETYEDGRFYVKRARDLSKECMIAVDKCSIANNTNTSENIELSNLQNEQLNSKQKQGALKLKQEKIKAQMAEPREKELKLKKEQLIISYKNAISENVKIYNQTLKVCNCSHSPLSHTNTTEDLSMRSVEDIKLHYNNHLKVLIYNYLTELNSCSN